MSTNLDLLLGKLTHVAKRGKEWVARCPAHEDSTPSLGITLSDTGKILIHCMADCAPADILAAVGMSLADLFPDKKLNGHVQPIAEPERVTCPPGRAAPTPKLEHPVHGKPTALHVYTTPDNLLWGYVMRFDLKDGGKAFCPYTYSVSDGWQYKAFTKPRPLYGLHRLRERPSGARILVEGEKAADAAALLAPQNACLTWCGGAGAVKHADLSPLAGQPVILWPDADEPGRKAVNELAERLSILQCSIRIVDTEGLPEGFDAADLKEPLKPWLTPRLRDYVARAAPTPAPESPSTPEAPVARPAATVTPITEARTRQQAKPDPQPVDYTPFADDSLARAFTAAHPELRYVSKWGKWLEWGENGWVEDTTLHVYDLARQLCSATAEAHRGAATPSSISACKSANKRAAVENLARSDRAHAASADQWDADRMVLNTPGGLVDLRNGSTRPVRMDDYCIKMTAATPIEGCPTWLDFLKYGTNGDDELIGFLRRWAGYCATGETREQKFVFLHGRGGSGKGTFLNTVARVLGTYAKTIAMETLTESHQERHPEELARLAGIRMAVASETQQGKRWNEARIKMITGEDSINARFMHQNSFDFVPQVKLSIMGNHPPGLRSVDASMKRRLLIAPFDHIPAEPDPLLPQKLWAERAGILFWIVCGTIEWQCDGLAPPASVIRASADYFENQDVTGQWMADCCDAGAGCESTIRALYKSYVGYVEPTGYQPLRQGELRDTLLTRGCTVGGYAKSPTIKGLRVRVDTSAQSSRFQD